MHDLKRSISGGYLTYVKHLHSEEVVVNQQTYLLSPMQYRLGSVISAYVKLSGTPKLAYIGYYTFSMSLLCLHV